MSNVEGKLVILCGSKFALPAIFYLHQEKKVSWVVCYTRNPEFEEEIAHFCNQYNIPLKILEKHSWKKQLQELLEEVKPLAVLIKTFAFKIPTRFFPLAKKGFINFHYALLPQYRGAFPLYEVLRKQEPYGGISVHYLTEEFDKGPVIMQQYVSIKPQETYGKHEINLANEGAKLSMLLAEMLWDDEMKIPMKAQDESNAHSFPKPLPSDLILKWNEMSAEQIIAMILATNPWCKGPTTGWANVMVRILFARHSSLLHSDMKPGEIIEISEESGLRVACLNNQSIWIDVIYSEEGYLPGFKLKDAGIIKGMVALNL